LLRPSESEFPWLNPFPLVGEGAGETGKANAYSSMIDGLSTKVIGGKMVKIISWYDNEWGFSNRMVELFLYLFGER